MGVEAKVVQLVAQSRQKTGDSLRLPSSATPEPSGVVVCPILADERLLLMADEIPPAYERRLADEEPPKSPS